MVDREQLAVQQKTASTLARSFLLAPVMLTGIAVFLSESFSPLTMTAPFSSVGLMVPFTLLMLSPLVAVPLIRRVLDRGLFATQRTADSAIPLGGSLMTRTIIEFAFWEQASLLAFVAVRIGAPLAYLFAGLALTLIGGAYSFPTWQRWEAVADRVDQGESPLMASA